jgi:hypothetical protein
MMQRSVHRYNNQISTNVGSNALSKNAANYAPRHEKKTNGIIFFSRPAAFFKMIFFSTMMISLLMIAFLLFENDAQYHSTQILSPTTPAPILSGDGKTMNTVNSEQQAKSRKNAAAIQELVCKDARADWLKLCTGGFAMTAAQQLLNGEDVDIVQIGAHVGFEKNDPLARGVIRLLDEVSAIVDESEKSKTRQRFHWTFVEPSPPNFRRLTENLSKNSAVCDMKGINAAVVSDSIENAGNMPFYSMRDTIDPETGHDSLSGKRLPRWITQVSSFNMSSLQYAADQFTKRGLVFEDYVVETDVQVLPFSKVMQQALVRDVEGQKSAGSAAMRNQKPPLLILIDTEGFDCDIIKGISSTSSFVPKFLVFEYQSCDHKGATEYLEKNFGFDFFPPVFQNIIGVRNK